MKSVSDQSAIPSRAPDCLFCRILDGSLPSRKVFEDDHALAFLDLQPFHPGHTLVIPKQHVADLVSGEPQLARIGDAVDTVARLLMDRLSADGLNIMSSAKPAAGQEVFHLHVHVIPRYAEAPGLANLINRSTPDDAELDAVHRRISGDSS